MLLKYFRWTVRMLNFDAMTNINEMIFKLILFVVFGLGHLLY